jgi:HSP20 family molecular chaperone IbpA
VTAAYRNGVLTVTLPKTEPHADDSRSIDIE